MNVIKRDGTIELFDESKVIDSMSRSGVDDETIKSVVKHISSLKYNNISTEELYKLVYKLVSKYSNKYVASIYSLKKALYRLGPSGYVFEDFVARIFSVLGKKVKTRQIYRSMCVPHELDVVGDDFFVECKYHNEGGIGTSIKDVMYSHARFHDLKYAGRYKNYKFRTFWVATNTKFSDDAVSYATFWKINLLGWRYPEKSNLAEIIDHNKLFPVTLLPSANTYLLEKLSRNNIILIKEFDDKSDSQLRSMGFTVDEVNRLRYDWRQIFEASSKMK